MAKKSIGLLNIVFGADLRGFDRAMKKAQRSIGKFGKNMQRVGANLTRNVTLPLLTLGAASVKMASDFAETDSKFKQVFSSIQKEAEDTAQTFRKSFGLSHKSAKQLLGDTGDLLVGFGFTEKSALELSKQVNELAVDLASFTNFSGGAEGASLALTKALLGERESIKSLGIAITEADLKSFAAEQGLVWKELDRITKANITFQLAMKQSFKAVGDYSRTSQGFANQLRQMQAQLSDTAVEIGTKLLPIAQKLLGWIRDMITSFQNLTAAQKQNILEWGLIAAAVGPVLNLFGTFLNLLVARLIPAIFSMTGVVMVLASALILLYNNLTKITSLIANTFASKFGAEFFSALGAAMKAMGIAGGDAFMTLGAQMATVVATGEDLPEEEWKSFGDIIKELSEDFKELVGVSALFTGGGGGGTTTAPNIPFALDPKSAGAGAPFIGPLEQSAEALEKIRLKMLEVNAATALFSDVMHNAMMDAANSQEGFFQSLFENLKRAIKQMLIQLAVLTAINIMLGGKGGVEAFNLAKGKLLGLQHGGLATGPTMALVGEGSGTSMANPEVIAPLDKLKQYIGGGDMRVTGRLVGNDIFLSNEKAGVSRNRFV